MWWGWRWPLLSLNNRCEFNWWWLFWWLFPPRVVVIVDNDDVAADDDDILPLSIKCKLLWLPFNVVIPYMVWTKSLLSLVVVDGGGGVVLDGVVGVNELLLLLRQFNVGDDDDEEDDDEDDNDDVDNVGDFDEWFCCCCWWWLWWWLLRCFSVVWDIECFFVFWFDLVDKKNIFIQIHNILKNQEFNETFLDCWSKHISVFGLLKNLNEFTIYKVNWFDFQW